MFFLLPEFFCLQRQMFLQGLQRAMMDLPSDQLELVKRILAERVPLCEVRVFGSRIQQAAK